MMHLHRAYMQLFALLTLGFILFSTHASTLSVYTEPKVVAPGEIFNLVIELDENAPAGLPDLSPLQHHFHIHGTGHSASYVFNNGQSKATTRWTITLLPKHTGAIEIPAIQVGQARSKAFSLDVNAHSQSHTTTSQNRPTTDQALLIKTSLSTKKPLLNQQVLYSVKIYHASSILDAAYQPPRLNDALLVPLGNNQQSQVIENGRPYLVEEQLYALFPQKTGTHMLFPPKFQALIYDDIPRRAEAEGQSASLEIQAIPKPFTSQDWLPAKAVSLTETYNQSDTHFTEGNTLTRTIHLKVTGLLAELLPLITPIKGDNYKVYPERPTFGNAVEGANVVSKTDIKIDYLLDHPGTITIPEQKIIWFNTETQQQAVATLPQKTLHVAPDVTHAETNKTAPAQSTPTEIIDKKPPPTQQHMTSGLLRHITLLTIFLCFGFVALLLKKILRRVRHKQREKHIPIRALKQACAQNNPKKTRDLLLIWAQKTWPHVRILNLADIIKQADDTALTEALNALSEALYHPKQTNTWQGDALIKAIFEFLKQQKIHRKKTKNTNPLPPVNPKS